MKTTTEHLRSCRRQLMQYVKQAEKTGRETDAAAWITDNLPALLGALENARNALTRRNEGPFKALLVLWGDCCPGGVLPDENALTRQIAAFGPSLSDCALLPAAAGAFFACEAARAAQKELTGDAEAAENVCACVRSLLALRHVDFDELTRRTCEAEQLLAADPTGEYAAMSKETQALYRRAVICGAKQQGVSEKDFAQAALNKAAEATDDRHIGFYLPLQKDKTKAAAVFLALEALFFLCCAVGAALWAGEPLFAPLLWLPLSAALFPLTERLRARLFPAQPLCAMDGEMPVTKDNAVLITVSGLLPAAGDSEKLYAHLSDLYAANRDEGVRVMLLLDKKNAPTPDMPEDAADAAAVERVVGRLNRDFGGGFAAAVRRRVYAPTEGEYTGFERKRGAVIALSAFLRDGDESRFETLAGDVKGLTNVRYLMALDGDTEISFGTLRRLVAAARHPLNRPVFGPDGVVRRGYGCFAPRSEVSLRSAAGTFFTRLLTEGGTLAYAPAVSERNMDLFGCSLFTGKGLIDVDAFNRAVGSRFEEGRILSHDILEGAMLRTAFAGECEITESFPGKPDSYFARMHRWVRGDVQNLRYLLRPVAEEKPAAMLPAAARWQLWQNVRRAAVPVLALACLLAAPFAGERGAAALFAAALLSGSADSLLSCLSALRRGGLKSLFGRYFSTEMSLSVKSLLRALLCAGMLPRKAFVCADALGRAAVRSAVTHKHLLRWTTALQAEGRTARPLLSGYLLPLAVCAILCLCGGPFGRLVGLLILTATLFSLANGLPLPQGSRRKISERDRETVRSFTAAAWRYYEGTVTEEEHHLPPDNRQETPVMRTARRTSPTNIGLYLVSVMAARDLGLIGAEEMLDRLSATLKTVAALPKYNGCLYNWYDTGTLAPLTPEYISTVDCGNFLCCLTALEEGLKELGGERAGALTGLIRTLRETTNLRFLYDDKRALFHVGFDAQKGVLSDSYYDLLMSEARMTSYYETAMRHVPAAHYRAAGRMLVRSGGRVTAASWTGTMFEYFMPALFIPTVENSFIWESLKACLAAQKRRMRGLPWGISESCFFAADHAGNYRYKAHGLASLALKRLADDEPVISPYSSFLALPFDFHGAMKNLSAVAALHATGPCGFYEAVDFTPARTGGEDYCIVRCYMAHHVGMSIVAAANALLDDIFVRRFMRDPAMRAGQSLLCEKVPTAPEIFNKRRYGGRRLPKELLRSPETETEEAPFAEAAAYGGEWLLAADRTGRNRSLYSSLEVCRYGDRCRGVTVSIRANGETATLNAASGCEGTLGATAFTAGLTKGDLRVSMALLGHPAQPALLVPVRLTNRGDKPLRAEVSFYFEPLLLPALREEPHPAFTDLFLRSAYDPLRRTLTFTRVSPVSAALCAGFYGGSDFRFTTDRETALPRDPYRDAPAFFAQDKSIGGSVSPAAVLTLPFDLPPGKSAEQVLALTCADTPAGAAERLEAIRATALPSLSAGARNPFAADAFSAPLAARFLRDAFFGQVSAEKRDAAQTMTADRRALWAVGVSGDLPLITVRNAERCADRALRSLLRLHKRLAETGVANDLALLTDAPGDYADGDATPFDRLLREEDLHGDKGRSGGVFVLRQNALPPETVTALTAFSSLLYPSERSGDAPTAPQPPTVLPAARPAEPSGAGVDYVSAFGPGSFTLQESPALPWCHTLANRSFGTLVSDRSPGFTWAHNAQLCRLTPWSNDPSRDFEGERLHLEVEGAIYDICNGAKTRFTDTEAVYKSVCGPCRVTTTVAVPEKGGKKRLLVEAENLSGAPLSLTAVYRILPLLSAKQADRAFLRCRITEEGVLCHNPLNGELPGVLLLYCDKTAACGVGEETTGAGTWPKASVSARLTLGPGERQAVVFGLCFAADEAAAVRLKHAPFTEKRLRYATSATGDPAADRFASALLLHQVRDTRLLARCGFYQCAGGWGFRDQLQDLLPLTRRDPQLCREVLIRMATAQFPEGDVLHWFHRVKDGDGYLLKGVRTRCSDDRLWLPYAVAQYVRDTGDRDLLRRALPFLSGAPLAPGESSRYDGFRHTAERASLYEHCLRAFAPVRLGRHSLPLMEGGDWNDGFDALGQKGEGESVWLAMFLRRTALDFARVCNVMHDAAAREKLMRLAAEMAEACEQYAWAGDRYLRAFADDGTPVGKAGAAQCAVDLLPQAWASLAELPDRERTRAALATAYRELFDEVNGVVRLFTPPFTQKSPRAGYINDYPAGVRENGGQYTHAAVWFLMALKKEGMTQEADSVLHALLPNEKYRSPEGKAVYKTEPYALAGDVYSAEGMEGRGGWSLYTGAAGWLLQYLAP